MVKGIRQEMLPWDSSSYSLHPATRNTGSERLTPCCFQDIAFHGGMGLCGDRGYRVIHAPVSNPSTGAL